MFKKQKRKIKNYFKKKRKHHTINRLEKRGVELSGLQLGLQIKDVRLTLTDEETGDVYSSKIIMNGDNIRLSKFKKNN